AARNTRVIEPLVSFRTIDDLTGTAIDGEVGLAVDVGGGEDRHALGLVHLETEVFVLELAVLGIRLFGTQGRYLVRELRRGLGQGQGESRNEVASIATTRR